MGALDSPDLAHTFTGHTHPDWILVILHAAHTFAHCAPSHLTPTTRVRLARAQLCCCVLCFVFCILYYVVCVVRFVYVVCCVCVVCLCVLMLCRSAVAQAQAPGQVLGLVDVFALLADERTGHCSGHAVLPNTRTMTRTTDEIQAQDKITR